MLKRKILDELLLWKEKNSKKCLIVSGARQVGKTYIIREFGKQYYSSVIELNFLMQPYLITVFSGNLDSNSVVTALRLNMPGIHIDPGNTLLFLDEIQECPNAITALKFLATDQRFDVICSGSALGMTYNRVTSYPVGYVEYLDMFALDFEEFLWANGIDNDILENLRTYFDNRQAVPEAIHQKMMSYVREYIAIGGMPEVVNAFISGSDYAAADEVQRRIYRDYLSDIARFALPDIKIKAENCYRSIPMQLNKDNHKFQYKIVEEKGTARKFESSLNWIINAHMAIPCFNVGFTEYPLNAHRLDNNIRLYPSDIGLLTCTYDYSLKRAIVNDTDFNSAPPDNIILRTAKGGIWEALVADILTKSGHHDLYFYRNESGTAEIEFLLEGEDGVIPIEVKAGKSGTHTLNNLLKKDDIKYGYKLASQNVGIAEKKITLPVYMAIWL